VTVELEILVPDGLVLRTGITSLSAADASGWFGLLPHHQKFVTLLIPCVLTFRDEDGRERYAAADGGVLLLEGDHISITTREAVVADRLEDVADAAHAMLETRRERESAARAEFAGLRASLLLELTRAEKGEWG
jgi:F-type H+-transporting ATPase subunit epsilon